MPDVFFLSFVRHTLFMIVSPEDIRALVRDKYDDDRNADIEDDLMRLAAGEPLAYVIGWIPFLGLKIYLDSIEGVRPLIPRPETEWWTERLITHIREHRDQSNVEKKTYRVLDLCAGSGAIGLSIQKEFPFLHVALGELDTTHVETIKRNALENKISESQLDIRQSDLFESFENESFDIIATNPPYIPNTRELGENVLKYEPAKALYSGTDGLDLIRRILIEAPSHLSADGELWMECDISNIEEAKVLVLSSGFATATILNDQYDRPRVLIATLAPLAPTAL